MCPTKLLIIVIILDLSAYLAVKLVQFYLFFIFGFTFFILSCQKNVRKFRAPCYIWHL